MFRRRSRWLAACLLLAGCGTTRWTDTQRTATEQMLISNAIDLAVSRMDVTALVGKPLYLDTDYLDDSVHKKYLISAIRQHLLDNRCRLIDKKEDAKYVVEARAGAIGTDRHEFLIGVPQTNLPPVLPGVPTQIPEIPFVKKTNQVGLAKLGLFAYERQTGAEVWQSELAVANANAKNLWVLGAGPIQSGTLRDRPTFAGEKLPEPFWPSTEDPGEFTTADNWDEEEEEVEQASE